VLFALFILTQSLALEIFQTGSIFYRFVFEQNSLDNKGIDCRVSHKNTFGLKKLGFSNFIFIFETSAIFLCYFLSRHTITIEYLTEILLKKTFEERYLYLFFVKNCRTM
jgi:hypothetical protein